MIDVDELEALLIRAACEERTVTYAEVLAHFGRRITPRRVYGLCRDLGDVCRRNRARGEPELAVLVVRRSDGLPGHGFFRSVWQDGDYDGPPTGPRARAYVRDEQERVFAHFAAASPGESPKGSDESPAVTRALDVKAGRGTKGSRRSRPPDRSGR